jgi:hypothetical protein
VWSVNQLTLQLWPVWFSSIHAVVTCQNGVHSMDPLYLSFICNDLDQDVEMSIPQNLRKSVPFYRERGDTTCTYIKILLLGGTGKKIQDRTHWE